MNCPICGNPLDYTDSYTKGDVIWHCSNCHDREVAYLCCFDIIDGYLIQRITNKKFKLPKQRKSNPIGGYYISQY